MADALIRISENKLKKLEDMLDGTYADRIAEQTILLQTPKVLTVGAASAQSAVVGANTDRVVLSATTDCWIAIGANPTAAVATAGSFFLAAGSQSYPISVSKGVTKVAAIQVSSGGYLSIIESA